MPALPPAVAQCVATLRAHGCPAYPVGGCVRDLLLGRTPSDWDVTTAATPDVIQVLFDKTVPTGAAHGTITVLLENSALEVTTFRADGPYSDGRHPDAVTFGVSLTEDLARRDFTVNAMALEINGLTNSEIGLTNLQIGKTNSVVIDPFGGQTDLVKKVIRAVGDPAKRFSEDALRMYRAVRFAAQLGFTLEEETAGAIPQLAHLSAHVAGERIKAEVEKTLISQAPELTGLLLDYGLLDAPIRPDLTPLRAVPPTPEARWRGFCELTGFDITALPVERRLKTAVLHPEREVIRGLPLTGGELAKLGYSGEEIGKVQQALAAHVLAHPEDNRREDLLRLLPTLPLT